MESALSGAPSTAHVQRSAESHWSGGRPVRGKALGGQGGPSPSPHLNSPHCSSVKVNQLSQDVSLAGCSPLSRGHVELLGRFIGVIDGQADGSDVL